MNLGVRSFAAARGVKKYHLWGIEAERRNGYSWYGQWGKEVATLYDKWKNNWPDTDGR